MVLAREQEVEWAELKSHRKKEGLSCLPCFMVNALIFFLWHDPHVFPAAICGGFLCIVG